MFYGAYENNGEVYGGFYCRTSTWNSDTFSPDTKVLALIDLRIHGSTYAERKEDLIRIAHEYLDLYSDSISLSWGEVAEFEAFFCEQGKRYGLLTEFRENGIC